MSDNVPKPLSNNPFLAKIPPPIVGKQPHPSNPKSFANNPKNPKMGKVGMPKGAKMNVVGKFSNGPPKIPPPSQSSVPLLKIPPPSQSNVPFENNANEVVNKVSPTSNQELLKKVGPKRAFSLTGSILKESTHVKASSSPSPREVSYSSSYDNISFSNEDFSSESSLEESLDKKKSSVSSFFINICV